MITDFIGTLFGSGSKSFSLSHPAADEKENFSEKEDQLHLNGERYLYFDLGFVS